MRALRVRRQTSKDRVSYSLAVPPKVAQHLDSRRRYTCGINSRGEIVYTPFGTIRTSEPRIPFDLPEDKRRTRHAGKKTKKPRGPKPKPPTQPLAVRPNPPVPPPESRPAPPASPSPTPVPAPAAPDPPAASHPKPEQPRPAPVPPAPSPSDPSKPPPTFRKVS